jgi:hypothetical protein
MKWKPIEYIIFWFWYHFNEHEKGNMVPLVWYISYWVFFVFYVVPLVMFVHETKAQLEDELRKRRFNKEWEEYKKKLKSK